MLKKTDTAGPQALTPEALAAWQAEERQATLAVWLRLLVLLRQIPPLAKHLTCEFPGGPVDPADPDSPGFADLVSDAFALEYLAGHFADVFQANAPAALVREADRLSRGPEADAAFVVHAAR